MKKLLAILTAAVGLIMTAHAQNYHFYDQNGLETGSARPDFNGGYRFYDQNGLETGSARPDFNGGYRFYDQNGLPTGSQRGGW